MTTAHQTTRTLGLAANHPPVWRLDIDHPGGTLTVYSLTRPERAPDDAPGFDNVEPLPSTPTAGEQFLERWPHDIYAWTLTRIPTAAEAARSGRLGRPPALSDDDLYALILPHAEALAARLGPRTPAFATGYSTSALVDTVRTHPEIVGDNQRIRTLCKRALAEAKKAWLADGAHHAQTLREADPPAPAPAPGPAWHDEALGLSLGQEVVWSTADAHMHAGTISTITGDAEHYEITVALTTGKPGETVTLPANVDPDVLRMGTLP